MLFRRQAVKMGDRLKNGERELKLGTTFSNPRNSSFHTLKYDFRPASVDDSKMATVDIGQSNQVTVTVPHLDGAGTPQTVFKGNSKNYTKECVLIVNKTTGEITIEKLTNNIQVKKTRSENGFKTVPGVPLVSNLSKYENATQRQSTKTKVTSGARKAAISGFIQAKHSPIQGSPTYPVAAQWSASHNHSNQASLPMIGFDDPGPPRAEGGSLSPAVGLPPSAASNLQDSASAVTNQGYEEGTASNIGVLSSSSSSSSSDSSDSESESEVSQNRSQTKPVVPTSNANGTYHHTTSEANILNQDLDLSESNSDSD